MKSFNVHEAKTHLSRLLRRVAKGEEVLIANAGRPIARLAPAEAARLPQFGLDVGKFTIPENFDQPVPEITAAFQGDD